MHLTDILNRIPRPQLVRNMRAMKVRRVLQSRSDVHAEVLTEIPRLCDVMQTRADIKAAESQVQRIDLPRLGAAVKFWDSLIALKAITEVCSRSERVLDAGAELYSPILPWLARFGFTSLTGCNIAFTRTRRAGPILYEYGDITNSHYKSGAFGAIACMSVIEHGVDLNAFFPEMARLLRPGGRLILSTDYWSSPIATSGQIAYGSTMKVFSKPEIELMIATAATHGLHLVEPPRFDCQERPVEWLDTRYTFIALTFERIDAF